MSIMVDCTSSPSVAALQANDVTVVSRYLSWMYLWNGVTHNYVNPKIILAPELERLHNGGIGVLFNWEFDARDALGGQANAAKMAPEAIKQMRGMGVSGVVCPASYDWDVQPAEWDGPVGAFAREWANIMRGEGFHPGAYGPYDLLTWVTSAGLSDLNWQSMSTSFSQHRNANQHPNADVWQKGHKTIEGMDTDWNVIVTDKLAQLCYGGSATPVAAPPPPYETLAVDGVWGFHTTKRLQQFFGTTPDGVISMPPARSSLVGAMQSWLNNNGFRDENGHPLVVDYDGRSFMPQDGHRTHSIAALERRMGTGVDEFLSNPSACVREMQRRLNANWF